MLISEEKYSIHLALYKLNLRYAFHSYYVQATLWQNLVVSEDEMIAATARNIILLHW